MKPWHRKLMGLGSVMLVLGFTVHLWLSSPTAPNATIFYGGDIITMDPNVPTPAALLVENGKITGAGPLDHLRGQAPDAALHDLKGAALMPGLIEPHTHPIAAAQFATTIDVSGFTHSSRKDVIETLRREIPDTQTPWALAFGWDPVMVDDLEPPTLAELDALSPDKPLLILTQMMHDAYANSLALAAANITDDSPNPPAGEFVKDAAGKLTGTIREVGAINHLFSAMPRPPTGTNDLLLNLFLAEYARAGYTTIGVLGPVGNDADPIALLQRRLNTDGAPVQALIYALPNQLSANSTPSPDTAGTPTIGVKFWMDGSPYAGGAAVREPYEVNTLTTDRLHLKPGHTGALMISDADYAAQFYDYHKRGFQIATHVQGELAVDRVLEVAEQVLSDHPRADHRHRLEHNALITEVQLKRAHDLGFTTSFFIDHIRFYGDKLPKLFGEARAERYMPIGSALSVGHAVSVHGDHPATPIGPLRSLITLLERKPNGQDEPIGRDQTLNRMDALRAMTIHPAWQLGIENTRGSLSVGKQADLVILSASPLTEPTHKLEDIQVLATWIAGQPIDHRKTTYANAKLLMTVIKNYLF